MEDDHPDQLYNVPPPPRPAHLSRSPKSKKRSTLLSQSTKETKRENSVDKVNGTSAAPPPVIDRSSKPRPPPINRDNKPGRSPSFKNDLPQMTKDSVHYVSLWKLKEDGKPVPRPRTNTKKTAYSEVSLDATLAIEKKFVVGEEQPQASKKTDSLIDVYSSDDDSSGSDISYTKMRVSDNTLSHTP